MDATEFGSNASGQLIPFSDGVAFLPDPPPTDLAQPPELITALAEASRAVGVFLGESRRVPDSALIINPLLMLEAAESNRIEGTHTIVSEVLRQQVSGPPSDEAQASRNLEVLFYRQALLQGSESIERGQHISEFLVKSLHQQLLLVGRGDDTEPGTYRDRSVLIGSQGDTVTTARFVPPPAEHVPTLMSDLISFMSSGSPYSPLITAAVAHYQFEAIHPFNDGNGRLGRLLVPLFLMDQGVIDSPILYLSVFFEQRRQEYYAHLKDVSTQGAWIDWILFFLEAVKARAEDSTAKVERILELQSDFQTRVRDNSGSRSALLAVDIVMSDVFITIPKVQSYAGCAYGTAKAAVATLECLGIVSPVASQYPATWMSPELLLEVYGFA